MAREKITAETEVSSAELAAILNLTTRRVQQLTKEGTITKNANGKYTIAEAVGQYIESKTLIEVGDAEVEAAAKKKIIQDARLKEAKATKAQLEAEELKGNMHRSEDVELLVNDMIFAIRSAHNALPGRVAVDCFAADSAEEVSNIIRREVHKIDRELATHQYNPAEYEQLVRERQNWRANADEDDEE